MTSTAISTSTSTYLVVVSLVIIFGFVLCYYAAKPIAYTGAAAVNNRGPDVPLNNVEIPQDASVHPDVDQSLCSKIFSLIGTILGNVPPWGWLLLLILLILFLEWLKAEKGRVVPDFDLEQQSFPQESSC